MTPTATVRTLKIDGRDFSARPDETILDVARENKIFIPRMCELEGLSTRLQFRRLECACLRRSFQGNARAAHIDVRHLILARAEAEWLRGIEHLSKLRKPGYIYEV